MNELRDDVRRFAWSLSPADMETLAGLDDSDQVLIGALNGDWQNVAGVQIPDGDSYLSLTLFASDTYDSRQF